VRPGSEYPSPNPQNRAGAVAAIPASGARFPDALRRIYDRPQPPVPWRDGANLPWDDPAFSERMLAQHLDPSHGAASRPRREILIGQTRQIRKGKRATIER
jgi:hypothetical protein